MLDLLHVLGVSGDAAFHLVILFFIGCAAGAVWHFEIDMRRDDR